MHRDNISWKMHYLYRYYFTLLPYILPDIIPRSSPNLTPSYLPLDFTYFSPSTRLTIVLYLNPMFAPCLISSKYQSKYPGDHPIVRHTLIPERLLQCSTQFPQSWLLVLFPHTNLPLIQVVIWPLSLPFFPPWATNSSTYISSQGCLNYIPKS